MMMMMMMMMKLLAPKEEMKLRALCDCRIHGNNEEKF